MKGFCIVLTLALLTTVTNGQNLNCNFDNDNICSWTQVNGTDNADWLLNKGPTPSQYTGPPNDHTTNSSTGYYIYYEASNGQTNDKAQLQSPPITVGSAATCLSFWYYMYGPSVNALNVYLMTGTNNLGPAVFHGEQTQGEKWNQATITISNVTNAKVVIEAVRGWNNLSDIGVDDILYTNGACGQSGECNFDQKNFCTWSNMRTDTFDWTIQQRGTPSAGTGPSMDHTQGNANGSYIFIETSAPRRAGDKAWLQSAVYSATGSSPKCLQFWYNMNGLNVGSLNVYLSQNGSVPGIPLWSLSRNQGTSWFNGQVTVQSNMQYTIIFEGLVGSGYLGNIALDDLSFTDGSCTLTPSKATPSGATTPASTASASTSFVTATSLPGTFNCNFESNTCAWTQATDDDFDWTRHQGSTSSANTGPTGDHTTGRGYYMYIEASGLQPNKTARLVSPRVTPQQRPRCLRFWYHMYGAHINTLNVYLQSGANLGRAVWTRKGTQGNIWIQGSLVVNTTSGFNVVFEALRGVNYAGDIAIDDISLANGVCSVCGFLLRSPQYGTVHYYSGSNYGSRAIYSCDSGYELQGNAERTCQETGFWNGTDPTCVQKDTRGAVTCMDCQNISDVSQCRTIRHCHTGQVCFVEQMSDIAGEVKYNAGCMFSNMCTFKSQGADHCVHCCNTDLCNVKGCGNAGFDARMNRGPLCYNCSNVGNIDECKSIALCGTDEVCMIQQLTNSGLDHPITANCHGHQCLAVPYEGLQQSSSDLYCCPGDLCNTRPDAQTGTGGSAAIIG